MVETPPIDPMIAKMTAMLETLRTRIETLEKKPLQTPKNSGKAKLDTELPAKLPEIFSATDLPKFKLTDDPKFHLKGFMAAITIKGIDHILYRKIFPLSLDLVCQKWFFSLSDKGTATWEDIIHVFLTRYKGKTQVSTSRRELEILKQDDKEGFTAYLARWKEVAAQMVNTPHKKETIKIFVSNLLPKYYNYLYYSGLETFDKGKWGNSNYSNDKKTDTSNSAKGTYTQAFDHLKSKGALAPVGLTADPPANKRSPRWDANKYRKYHQGNGHTNEECWTLKNKLQDMPNIKTSPLTVILIGDEETSFDPTKYITPIGCQYTPLVVSYTQAYCKLLQEGLTAPMGPTPDPPLERRFDTWDTSKYYDYHRGRGHSAEECRKVKDLFQNLMDNDIFVENLVLD
ncbi:Short neurotoxin 3, partial [Bienertia sinuspersici]